MCCRDVQSQSVESRLSGNIRQDILSLLPQGETVADVMDSVKHNPRELELATRFRQAIQENYGWFVEYMKKVPTGQAIPYDPKMGLTQAEYSEMQSYGRSVEATSSGTEKISITRNGDIIEFKAGGKLRILQLLKINLASNIISLENYQLVFSDSANITTDENSLKSKWKGYIWRFEDPKDVNMDALKDLSGLNLKRYQVTIGRLEKNHKTVMTIKGTEVLNGVKKVNFEIPILF